jgi:chromate transporter
MANVVSRKVMGRLIEADRPSVIFHAAACKHVPMMEEHPSEGVHVNVAGTQAVLDAAVDPLVAGLLGSVITTWVTFAPCFLFILTGAPYLEYLRGHRGLNAALAGIMAAVVGVVLNLAIWFGLHTLFGSVGVVQVGPFQLSRPDLSTIDWAAVAIALAALAALQWKRVGLLTLLGGAMVAGLAVQAIR